MEHPADHSEPHGWSLKKTQIRLDTDEVIHEKLAAHGDGTHYIQHKNKRLTLRTGFEPDIGQPHPL